MKDVSAGIITCNGKLLIAQRRHGKNQEYLWEFPGGKLEEGETLPQCLQREIKEELDKEITIGDFFMTSVYEYENGAIRLHAYFATTNKPEIPSHMDHEQVKWIDWAQIDDYTFAPADIPIKNALKKLYGA